MTDSEAPPDTPAGKSEADESSFISIGDVLLALVLLLAWLLAGAIFNLLPFIGHNFVQNVGIFAVNGMLFTWIALPFTAFFAFATGTRGGALVFCINFIAWCCFVAYVWGGGWR